MINETTLLEVLKSLSEIPALRKDIQRLIETQNNESPELTPPIQLDEAVRIAGKSKPWFYPLLRKGKIPGASKRGNTWYFDKKALIDWLMSGETKTAKEFHPEDYLA